MSRSDTDGKQPPQEARDGTKGGGKPGKQKKAKSADRPAREAKEEILGEVRRLAADLAGLRGEVSALRAATASPAPPNGRGPRRVASAADVLAAPGRAAAELSDHLRALVAATGAPVVALGYALPAGEAAEGGSSGEPEEADAALITGARLIGGDGEGEREARAGRLGFALSSPQKVALARLLLENDVLSAAQLGAAANLTTGSLYHHLREMQHAGVVGPAGRSRYCLTPLGRQATLLLLALAERHSTSGSGGSA